MPASALAAEWVLTPIHSFDASNPVKGDNPNGNLVMDSGDVIYGATYEGGANNFGTIFSLTKRANGTWKHVVLHSFAATDGARPTAGLVRGEDGALYGTTTAGGGAGACGTAFRFARSGGAWAFRVLHAFDWAGGEGCGNRGILALDEDGNIFGTTTNSDGSNPGEGIVYRLKRPANVNNAWPFKILHAFTGNNGGKDPEGGVTIGAEGELYGVSGGSPTTPGTLYRLTPNSSGTVWTHRVLRRFVEPANGRYPTGTLAQDDDGTLYGVTFAGGFQNPSFLYGGVVFSYEPSAGAFAVIHRFGTVPQDALVPAFGPLLRVGKLFGTTTRGGVNDDGAVYRSGLSGGGWTVLHSFNGPTDGEGPRSPLLFRGGSFYGAARSAGPNGGGTIFVLEPAPL